MSNPPPTPKRRERPWNRLWFLILLSIGLLIPTTFIIWRISVSVKVNSDLAALKKAGYPTSMQELERMYYPKLKPEENAATFFNEAFRHIDLSNSAGGMLGLLSSQKIPRNSIHFSPENKAKIYKALNDSREALETLGGSPPAKPCQYPVDVSKGYGMLLPHLAWVKAAAAHFDIKAILDIEDNQPGQAMEDLQAAFRLSHSLAGEPWLISQMVRNSCLDLIRSTLERILSNQQLTENQLLELSQSFRREENPHAMEKAMASELCMGIQLFQMSDEDFAATYPQSKSDDPDESSKASGLPRGRGLMKASGFMARDFDYFLQSMSQHLAVTKLPFPEKLDAAEKLDGQDEKDALHSFYVFSGLLLPSSFGSTRSEARALARMNIIQSVLAIERYRLANQDRLPDKLDDLVPSLLPSMPIDPFDGKPLRFKKLPKGYMVYSIGPDRKDDGGVDRIPKKQNSPEDITFRVER